MKILVKLTKLTIIFSIIGLLTTSCEDMMGNFLDKPPGVDVTEDTIFSTQINVESFLTGIYRNGMYADIPEWTQRNGNREYLIASMTDEGECPAA